MTNCFPVLEMIAGHSAVLTGENGWQSIPWGRVMRLVKSIQSRIVKAVQAERWNKVNVLQGILTKSYSARLLAIRRITENRGKRTPGIDEQLWDTPLAKFEAISQLRQAGYQPQPVRRIKIRKGKDKWRPLGIPTMKDRAMQALYLLALDPVSETLADINSYGFRLYRSCADAIARCFSLLSKQNGPVWILEGDIKGCFDNISHQWIEENIPLNKAILTKWLKAGHVEKMQFFPSRGKGTPQGSVISPTLANMVLDGLELAIDKAVGVKHYGKTEPKRRINPSAVHFIRYADDFVVTCSDKTLLMQCIQPAIIKFLAVRGLELSEQKTHITHIDDGFDFLGQNIKKYNNKLLIKPSKNNIQVFLEKVKVVIKEYATAKAEALIIKLIPKIRGWAMYHRHVSAKETFNYVDNRIWQMLWRWAKQRHPDKSSKWVKQKYFMRLNGRDWTFFAKTKNGAILTILHASKIKIQRHPKIRGRANPYNKEEEAYFEKRIELNMLNKLEGKGMMRSLYNNQNGCCLVCNQRITAITGWNAHHLQPKYLGGKWSFENLVLLHPVCHIQVHQNDAIAAALTIRVKR